MKILVTGGAGFIGSNIVDAFIEAGHAVTVVDDTSTGNINNVNPKATFYRLDIRNKSGLEKIFSKHRFDIVDHHAAQIDVRKSVEDPRLDADINIGGVLNLLDCIQKHRVKKIIFSSSGGTIYGECPKPAKEGDPEIPLSPYGIAKLASEKYIQAAASLHNFNYTIFRYSNVYGPRQDPKGEAGVVAIFSDRLLDKKRSFIFGNGRQSRDFVFVNDIVQANLLAIKSNNNGIYNIGTGREVSVTELFKKMAAILDNKMKPIYKPARPGELQKSVLNYSKARKELHWQPHTTIEEGLKSTIQFFRSKRKPT